MPDRLWSRRLTLAGLSVATGGIAASSATARMVQPDMGSLDRAVEALRTAMISGDGPALNALLHDRLVYMHSSGHSQSKANLLADLAGKRFFADLAYPQRTIDVEGGTGTAVLTVNQVKNLPSGGTRASQIKVIQTWAMTKGGWQLFARSSAILSSPLAPSCKPGATNP